jgi:hypothetical protein
MRAAGVFRLAVALLATVATISACGQAATGAQAVPSPASCAPQASQPKGACVSQGFRISGELTGTVADAFVEEQCAPPLLGDAVSLTVMHFDLAGNHYKLSVDPGGSTRFLEQPLTVTQTGASTVARLELTDRGTAPALPTWVSTSGSLLIDSSGTGGMLSLSLLAQNTSGARPLRLDGAWHCAPPVVAPSPSPGPCSALISAAHPEGTDLSQLNAAQCHAVSLDFSGALSGHADQAAVLAPAADLQAGCNRSAQLLTTRLATALGGRIVVIGIHLHRDPLRGEISAGPYPDPGFLEALDGTPIAVSAGRLSWSYTSGTVTLDPDLGGAGVWTRTSSAERPSSARQFTSAVGGAAHDWHLEQDKRGPCPASPGRLGGSFEQPR